jgi:copper chaperone
VTTPTQRWAAPVGTATLATVTLGPHATAPVPRGATTVSSTRTFQVPAISCGHCKASIEGAVGELGDVDRVEVDIAARTVTVAGDASDEDITAAIDEAGYEVAGRTDT